MKFQASIENGKIRATKKDKLSDYLNTLEGEKITVDIKKWRNIRSNNQNAYYWFAIDLLTDTGYTREEWHGFFKLHFLPKEMKINGEVVGVTTGSTTNLDTKQFSEYMELIRQFAQEKVDIYIPQANEIPPDQLEHFYNLS